jgi:hypothetical protein
MNDSYSDRSFKEIATINTKKDGRDTLRMMGTRVGGRKKQSTVAQRVDDSIQTDKSD